MERALRGHRPGTDSSGQDQGPIEVPEVSEEEGEEDQEQSDPDPTHDSADGMGDTSASTFGRAVTFTTASMGSSRLPKPETSRRFLGSTNGRKRRAWQM